MLRPRLKSPAAPMRSLVLPALLSQDGGSTDLHRVSRSPRQCAIAAPAFLPSSNLPKITGSSNLTGRDWSDLGPEPGPRRRCLSLDSWHLSLCISIPPGIAPRRRDSHHCPGESPAVSVSANRRRCLIVTTGGTKDGMLPSQHLTGAVHLAIHLRHASGYNLFLLTRPRSRRRLAQSACPHRQEDQSRASRTDKQVRPRTSCTSPFPSGLRHLAGSGLGPTPKPPEQLCSLRIVHGRSRSMTGAARPIARAQTADTSSTSSIVPAAAVDTLPDL